MQDLEDLNPSDLLRRHVDIEEELRRRNILRSSNKPTGDLAEYIFCAAFDWKMMGKVEKAFDARDEAGIRYQIKGRRQSKHRNNNLTPSSVRSFDFDVFAAVLFGHHYDIQKAYLLPVIIYRKNATYVQHTNGYQFSSFWNKAPSLGGVEDVTDKLRAFWG